MSPQDSFVALIEANTTGWESAAYPDGREFRWRCTTPDGAEVSPDLLDSNRPYRLETLDGGQFERWTFVPGMEQPDCVTTVVPTPTNTFDIKMEYADPYQPTVKQTVWANGAISSHEEGRGVSPLRNREHTLLGATGQDPLEIVAGMLFNEPILPSRSDNEDESSL